MTLIQLGCQIAKNAHGAVGLRKGFFEGLNALPPDEKRQALAALAEARRSVAGLSFFTAQMVAGIVNAETMIPRGMRSVVLPREEAEELDCEDLAQKSKR